MAKKMNSDN